MNTEKMNHVVSMVANLGVIAGIIFLAIEVRQNTSTLEAQMRFNHSERATEMTEEIIRSPHFNDARFKFAHGELLSPQEDGILRADAFRMFDSWQYIWGEVQRGIMPEDVMTDWGSIFRSDEVYDSNVYAHYWDSIGKRMRPEFRTWMEENVVN